MGLRVFRPTTPTRRQYSVSTFEEITRRGPERALVRKLSNSGGRNSRGRVTSAHRGGGHKRRYRVLDFRRDKIDVPGKVLHIEYDPNRTARIALIAYADGEKRYILAPDGLKEGGAVITSDSAEIRPGNTLSLKAIPLGETIHGIELKPGGGAQLVRSAGGIAQLMAKEGEYGLVKLPSGEMRRILITCRATIGMVGNSDHSNREIGKAGRSRWLNRRPSNRGVARNPVDHPMGGGEGKTSGGRQPVSKSGIPSKGYKTRQNKRTSKFIVRRRR